MHKHPADRRPTLALSYLRAYQQYQMAEKSLGDTTDRQAYDWLKERVEETERLPDFNTWTRYLRTARKFYGTQKNTPRGGRTGRSIVEWGEIEHPRKDEGNDD